MSSDIPPKIRARPIIIYAVNLFMILSDQSRLLTWARDIFYKPHYSYLSTLLIRRKWLSKGYTTINANCSKSDLFLLVTYFMKNGQPKLSERTSRTSGLVITPISHYRQPHSGVKDYELKASLVLSNGVLVNFLALKRTFSCTLIIFRGLNHPFMQQKPCAKEEQNIGCNYNNSRIGNFLVNIHNRSCKHKSNDWIDKKSTPEA